MDVNANLNKFSLQKKDYVAYEDSWRERVHICGLVT